MDHDPSSGASRAPGAESGMMRFFLPGLVVGMVLGSILGLYVGTRSGGAKLPDSITNQPRLTGPGSHGEDAAPATPSDRSDEPPATAPEKPAETPPAASPEEKKPEGAGPKAS